MSESWHTQWWSLMMSWPSCKIIPPARYAVDNKLEPTPHPRTVVSASVALTAPDLVSSPLPASSPPPQTDMEDDSSFADHSQAWGSPKWPSSALQESSSLDSIIILSLTTSDGAPHTSDINPAPKAKKSKTLLTSGDLEGPMSIIDINDIDDPQDEQLNRSNPTANIKFFFSPAPRLQGQSKRCMKCNLCVWVSLCFSLKPSYVHHRQGLGCAKQNKVLISEHSTLWCHAVALHMVHPQSPLTHMHSILFPVLVQKVVWSKPLWLDATRRHQAAQGGCFRQCQQNSANKSWGPL